MKKLLWYLMIKRWSVEEWNRWRKDNPKEIPLLDGVDLRGMNLVGINLNRASLNYASLNYASLNRASLNHAFLEDTKGLIKPMGVEVGGIYWKRIGDGLMNNDYQFVVGINRLKEGEVFASDPRVLCSYPGFHFASRSWVAANYSERPYEVKLRIPEGAQINEPWATDGKASADRIDILQVFNTKTGQDVTDQFL